MDFIPQIEPWIDEAELEELRAVISSTFITENEKTKAFEEKFKELTGAKHAIAYANGTLGLLGSLIALGLKPGDEVLVPDLTFIATATPLLLLGATPVFCDIDEATLQIDPTEIERKLTPKTRGIIPVHLYGYPADMSQIMEIAKRQNLFVLEDAAESIGATLNGNHVGTIGDIGMISFYANKTLTTAEGAILLTNDDALALRLYQLKNHGRSKKGVFVHESLGFNFSFSDLHAAIGLAQFKKLDRILSRKKELERLYHEGLQDIPEIEFPRAITGSNPSFWFINIHVPDAENLSTYLKEKQIGSRPYFYPMHAQPCFEGRFGGDSDFPKTMRAFARGLSLPSSYSLTNEQVTTIVNEIHAFFRNE